MLIMWYSLTIQNLQVKLTVLIQKNHSNQKQKPKNAILIENNKNYTPKITLKSRLKLSVCALKICKNSLSSSVPKTAVISS